MIRPSGGPVSSRRAAFLFSFSVLVLGLALSLTAARTTANAAAAPPLKTRAVVLIVLDGFRWQEVLNGPEHDLMDAKHGNAQDEAQLRKDFWRDTPEAGRQTLMPFLWTVVAKQGQIYGNQRKGSVAQVTNGFKFSYPGYNEMATGYPNPQINSNEFGPNPNATVFEWLNNQPEFHNEVAIFGTWDTFNDIFRAKQSGLLIRAGWNLPWAAQLTPREQLLKKLYETSTRVEDDDAPDSFTHEDLLDYLQTHSPRALFVGYGETDDWAHAGKYDLVLQAAHADQRETGPPEGTPGPRDPRGPRRAAPPRPTPVASQKPGPPAPPLAVS